MKSILTLILAVSLFAILGGCACDKKESCSSSSCATTRSDDPKAMDPKAMK